MKLNVTRWDKKPPLYKDHRMSMELELTAAEFNGLTREREGIPTTIMKLLKEYINHK